jgi:hypothetical protein
VHGNHSVGIWVDTDNRGFDIFGNYIADNYSVGLTYEVSYNARIADNLFARNGLGNGPTNPGFPTPALYISESGSDPRVAGPYRSAFTITGNVFIDNWAGVILWENSNRFCGSPASGTDGCTLADPAVANAKTCDRAHLAAATSHQVPDYYDLCRWKTQNVSVTGNEFYFAPGQIGPACTPQHGCGFVGIFSEWGSYPSWSPYMGTTVEYHITFDQDNHFADNTYIGPWHFMALAQGAIDSWSTWRLRFRQDAGSAFYP